MARREAGAVSVADSENRNGPKTDGAFITCKAGAFTRSRRRREMADHLRPPAVGPGVAGGADAAVAARAPMPRHPVQHLLPRRKGSTLRSAWKLIMPPSS